MRLECTPKLKGKEKGLAASDAREVSGDTAAAAGTWARFCVTGIDKQMRIPDTAPTGVRKERKESQVGGEGE